MPPLVSSPKARLFLISFLVLFFELVCIRWIPSYVRYLSYFSNFVLLGAFLGIGAGALAANRKFTGFPLFPMLLLLFIIVVRLVKFDLMIAGNGKDVLYFQGPEPKGTVVESYWLLPLMFGFVAVLFAALGQQLGRAFQGLPPLKAYLFNILGSLAGTFVFFIFAMFSIPPVIWFSVTFLLVLALLPPRQFVFQGAVLLASVGLVWSLSQGSTWSPYYRITLWPVLDSPGVYSISVNNITHQVMVPHDHSEPFYHVPYWIFKGQRFNDVLIVGAGSGTDTSVALAHGAQTIDAVEIDPEILSIGSRYHPDHPYQDKRVRLYNEDARAFLRRTDKKYDLIVYALPDSLALTSSFANVRLESFLFTRESFESAREHLKADGLLVLYNYYREPWLIRKIGTMLHEVFAEWPLVVAFPGAGRVAVLMAGPKVHPLEATQKTNTVVPFQGPSATDDWPFIYLKGPGLSNVYLGSLVLAAVFAVGLVWLFAPAGSLRRINPHFFFLGAGFMLLEVKSIVGFSLLFGSTWMVNSLVIFAILALVLLAILLNMRIRIRAVWALFALLVLSLALAYAIPPQWFLGIAPGLRYFLASLLGFFPIFLGNVLFSHSFRDTREADVAFGSNLLGAMFGGMLEYLALILGYRTLILFAILFYALAMLTRKPSAVS